jgi:soluble lytic murein transglycosylase
MLVKQSQRYQKIQNLSRQGFGLARYVGLWLLLSVGLVGCAGAQAPTSRTDAASVAEHEAEDPVPAKTPEDDPRLHLPSAMPPQARHGVFPPSTPQALQALASAREAMQKKQWSRLASLAPQAQTDPLLGSYVQYWLLRQQLQDSTAPIPTASLQQFMKATQDDYLADRIKADWIVAAMRTGDYATINRLGPVISPSAQVDCALLMAEHMTGTVVTADQVMTAFEPVSTCWTLLGEMVDRNVVGWNNLEPLLRATLETSKTGNARRIASLMFTTDEMASYDALMKSPDKWLATQKRPTTRPQIELVTLALSRMARDDDRVAAAAYVKSAWSASMPKSNMQWVWGQFGLVAALNVDSDASGWYRRSGNVPMTDYNHAWQVRAELRQPEIDWAWVAKAIEKMTARQQAEPVWVYWHGRAMEAQGHAEAAKKHFESIAGVYGFYGQLANEELHRRIPIPQEPKAVTKAELARARSNEGLQRAVRLFDLGWRSEAVPEWNFSLRGMDDRQLLAAAEYAKSEQIYDRVVNTSLKTRDEIDFRQRFIAPFEGRVAEKAKQIDLDPAWVYGLIRQESRFITNARSHVGASGLMQLMPSTARWVARKLGMKNFSPSSVNDFDTNTILGTNYLSMVLNKLDGSQVLATAGYNAGPRRSVQWRAKLGGPVEGAIFAETIPFTETRLYVKHVMSNAVYYAILFSGKPQSLKARLGTITPEPTTNVALP